MLSKTTLQETVRKAQKGDLKALSELYELYVDRIYRYIFVRVQNKEEAEDLTSQVFLKMVEKIAKFTWQRSGFTAWLFKTAHNQVVDWYRSKPPREAEKETEQAVKINNPEELALVNETITEVLKSLSCLSELQRDVLVLRLLSGLSCQQTAQVLGLTEGNVRLIQHRALAKLKSILKVKVR